jgi:hypothetical protein
VAILCSCTKESEHEDAFVQEGNGTIWLSGGLYFCAEQIRMDEGDTLVMKSKGELAQFHSGERVLVKYIVQTERQSGCTIGKECELIGISKIE